MNAALWHTVFIVLHAALGVVAFVAGCLALRRSRAFGTYWWSLVGMAVFLMLAVAVEWRVLDPATRVVFGALVALAGVMLWRAQAARRLQAGGAQRSRGRRSGLPSGHSPVVLGWSPGTTGRYFDHVGFTLISLFDAFAVVTVLNAGAPGWLIAATGVVVGVAGHVVLVSVRRQLVATDA